MGGRERPRHFVQFLDVEQLDQPVHTLSGGQKTRVWNIADGKLAQHLGNYSDMLRSTSRGTQQGPEPVVSARPAIASGDRFGYAAARLNEPGASTRSTCVAPANPVESIGEASTQ